MTPNDEGKDTKTTNPVTPAAAPAGKRDAATGIGPQGQADQKKVPTTQISTPPVSATVDPKKVEALAKKLDKTPPGSGGVEHVGEAGPGVEETGKDTGIEPGKNVGLQTVSAEAHQKALNQLDQSRVVRKNSRKRLTEEEVSRLSNAERRAVAHDRGYELGKGGRKVQVADFLKAQEEDDSLDPVEAPKK